MFGTPWHGEGELSAAESAPLERIFFIEQARENALLPMTPGAAMARLFTCCFPPLHDPAALASTLAFLDELGSSVRSERLMVVPDRSVVDFVLASR